MKLGRLPPRNDPRTLRLARYLTPDLPPAPESVDYGAAVPSWPMYRNDAIGDCTCAAAGHCIEAWTQASRGAAALVSDADVLAAYEAVSGYVPGIPASDTGAVELDVLRYWRSRGVGGHQIGAFASVDPGQVEQVKHAVHLFGGAYLGVALPVSAEGQVVWDVVDPSLSGPSRPGSWGGHAINVVAYDAGGLTVVTWGALRRMTWAFFGAYVDEAWALLSPDWLGADAHAPVGLDLEQLRADLDAVGSVPSDVALVGSSVAEFFRELANAVARFFADLFSGKSEGRLVADAQTALFAVTARYLWLTNEVAIVSDLRALAAQPAMLLAWLRAHPYAVPEPSAQLDASTGPAPAIPLVQGPGDPSWP